MATENPVNPQASATAPSAAVTLDPQTAELLAKHAAGEKLNQSQYGKLGAIKAGWNRLLGNKSGGSAQAGSGNAAPVGAMAPAQTSGDGMAAVPVNPALVQRTTSAILRRTDAITVRWVEGWAREAGADDRTLARSRDSASLAPADRELISELSPDILQELGVDPRKFPLLTAGAVVGLHITNLWLVVDDLKRLAAKRKDALAVTDRAAKTPAQSQKVTVGDPEKFNVPIGTKEP